MIKPYFGCLARSRIVARATLVISQYVGEYRLPGLPPLFLSFTLPEVVVQCLRLVTVTIEAPFIVKYYRRKVETWTLL
uniref:Uncharacterized protein n=1 Tax=Lepeophtheirus salmonis TaxID=72036 RepID=A0A0K2URS0_LEPSM